MTSRRAGFEGLEKREHMENSYVLAEVPKKRGKKEEFSVRLKIPTKKFPVFF
jgi:hypothetical protein